MCIDPHPPASPSLPQELEDAVGPILEGAGLSEADVAALCDGIMAAFRSDDGPRAGTHGAASGRDLVLDLRGIILAYAGRARTLRPNPAQTRRARPFDARVCSLLEENLRENLRRS